jgi:hypothetical protein
MHLGNHFYGHKINQKYRGSIMDPLQTSLEHAERRKVVIHPPSVQPLHMSKNRKIYGPHMPEPRARFFKRLRSPEIDSKESIPPTYVADGLVQQSYSYLVPSPHGLFKNSSTETGSLHSGSCVVKTSFGHIPSIEQSKTDVFMTVI